MSTAMLDKPWEFTSAISRAWCTSASLPLRRLILRANPWATLQAEANVVALPASILDSLYRANLSARVAWLSTSMARAAALSHATTASWEEATVARTTVAWVASTATVASYTHITFFDGSGMSAVPRDRYCRSKSKEI
jgi:hypothetical protein